MSDLSLIKRYLLNGYIYLPRRDVRVVKVPDSGLWVTLLLLLLLYCRETSSGVVVRSTLPFMAGGRLPFWQDFSHVVMIWRACVRVAVAEFLCSVTDLTKGESPHTGYTFTPWAVSFNPPSIEHQVGRTSILLLFRRTVESHEIDSPIQTGQPGRCSDS